MLTVFGITNMFCIFSLWNKLVQIKIHLHTELKWYSAYWFMNDAVQEDTNNFSFRISGFKRTFFWYTVSCILFEFFTLAKLKISVHGLVLKQMVFPSINGDAKFGNIKIITLKKYVFKKSIISGMSSSVTKSILQVWSVSTLAVSVVIFLAY